MYVNIITLEMLGTSLVPRPSAASALLTFELARNQKLGGESGEFYHVSDVKGREKVERT